MPALLPPPRTGAAPLLDPEHLTRVEDGERLHALLWRPGPGWRMVSSAVLGGGIGERAWVLNAQVAHGYRRTDPARHLAGLARAAGARGPGVGLMTAADVSTHGRARDGGAEAVATAGVSVRGWASAPQECARAAAPQECATGAAPPECTTGAAPPGTVNIVVALPVALSDAALVNAVMTATEAKVQALLDAGLDCSGTPTDAVCVAARTPRDGADVHAFAGPRSQWGARLARAVHRAVRAALPAVAHP
ncbi:adenosylcobinamide amidohydrolase [Streptomyces sp. IBSBF 2507]|uniref:adenosylcobinamide amidohydrolase n=1 Tax=Streptomyces sp. IBSBF 2507 TaxID=2903530 RepID=UPI00351EC5D1